MTNVAIETLGCLAEQFLTTFEQICLERKICRLLHSVNSLACQVYALPYIACVLVQYLIHIVMCYVYDTHMTGKDMGSVGWLDATYNQSQYVDIDTSHEMIVDLLH